MKIKFKKSSICILVFIIIILIIAVFTNISSTGSSNTSDSFYSDDSTTEITSDISTKQTNTSYGCLDKDYCYITNPFRLASIDFLAVLQHMVITLTKLRNHLAIQTRNLKLQKFQKKAAI